MDTLEYSKTFLLINVFKSYDAIIFMFKNHIKKTVEKDEFISNYFPRKFPGSHLYYHYCPGSRQYTVVGRSAGKQVTEQEILFFLFLPHHHTLCKSFHFPVYIPPYKDKTINPKSQEQRELSLLKSICKPIIVTLKVINHNFPKNSLDTHPYKYYNLQVNFDIWVQNTGNLQKLTRSHVHIYT